MFTLDKVVPWGRSFDEYQRMFALTQTRSWPEDRGVRRRPRQFQCRGHAAWVDSTTCDPMYRYYVDQLQERIAATYEQILGQTRRNAT